MRLAKLVSSGGSLLEAAFREHKGEFCVGDFPGDFRVGDIRAGELCERDLAQETLQKMLWYRGNPKGIVVVTKCEISA
jgi:hypothetical protein